MRRLAEAILAAVRQAEAITVPSSDPQATDAVLVLAD